MNSFSKAWGVFRSVLHEKFSFGAIKAIVGHAGIDLGAMAHLEQTSGGKGASKSQILSVMDRQVASMDNSRFTQFLRIVTEEMVQRKPEAESYLKDSLQRLGWALYKGDVVEVIVFDTTELPELPSESHVDLVKAATRLRDGDLSGAVSAACGAVDTVTSTIFRVYNLGDPTKASFQEKVNRSLEAKKVIAEVKQQLLELGWAETEAIVLAKNLQGSFNQSAYVMQSLRSKMADVHGTKPILKPLAFDSIKWATLIVRILA